MSDNLIDVIEEFLAEGGEPDDRIVSPDGKPIFGTFTFEEMRAKYGDAWADDFKRQFRDFTGFDLAED